MKRRKAMANLDRRTRAYEATVKRQTNNDFRPNATGGLHKVHAPGSLKK